MRRALWKRAMRKVRRRAPASRMSSIMSPMCRSIHSERGSDPSPGQTKRRSPVSMPRRIGLRRSPRVMNRYSALSWFMGDSKRLTTRRASLMARRSITSRMWP